MNFVLVMSHIYSIPVVKVLATGDSKELNGAHLGETSIFPYTNRKDTHQPVHIMLSSLCNADSDVSL